MQTSVTRNTILLSLLLVTGSASAEWSKTASSDFDDFYIDPSTITKNGDQRRVWTITNYKQRTPAGEMSNRMRLQFDCKEERFKSLALSKHTELMAKGKITYSDDGVPDWHEIPPDSNIAVVLKAVCAK